MRAGRLLRYATSPQFALVHESRTPTRSTRACAWLAGAALLVGAGFLVALHVLPASRGLDPLREPLSEYAFASDGWLFNVAVSALAVGLAFLVWALVRSGCLTGRSPASALLAACSLSLVLVVVFPEHDASGAVQTAGRIHWLAAMLAFGGLTLAPALLGRHRASMCSRLTSLTRRLSACTCPCFILLLAASLARYETPLPVPAWSFGLGERLLVSFEFALAGVLIAWAWRGCACRLDRVAARELRASPDPSAQLIHEQRAAATVGSFAMTAGEDDGNAKPATRRAAA